MNVLLIGSGGREHAIAKAIKQSKHAPALFCFGTARNPGIVELCDGYSVGTIADTAAQIAFAKEHNIDWAIVGPDPFLEAGTSDAMASIGVPCVGPPKKLAQLETSKTFTRNLLTKYNIPGQARFQAFSIMDGVAELLDELGDAYVVKADGLMGGKGVKVAGDHLANHAEAIAWCEEILAKGSTFLIEEKLVGQEFSYISLCDGEHLAHSFAIQDHKRAFEGDKGPNTGGMGTYSDADHSLPFLQSSDIEEARAINEATAAAIKKECGMGYKGVLYGGFMATKSGVRVIEYNARFGDPEALNIFALLRSDFVETCLAIMNGTLTQDHFLFEDKASVCKYVAPEGYPTSPLKNEALDISGVRDQEHLYLAAVDSRDNTLYMTGSRTAGFVGIGATIAEAEQIAQAEIEQIKGPLFYRRDIGTATLIATRVEMMNEIRS